MVHIAKQAYRLLNPKERLQFLYVLLSSLILTSLELLGIGSIVAFLAVLAQPTLVFENEWLNKVYEFLNFEDTQQFILVCGFSLLLIYVLRTLFAAFTVWLQLRFVWGLLLSLSRRLLENYIYRPYHYFLTHNSSEIQRNLLSEISQVIHGVITPAMNLVTQSVLAFCILGLLFWNDALLASVVTALFGGSYAWVYLGFRHKLSIIGAARVAANKLRFKTLSEAVGGIKDLRISGREDYFIETFTTALRNFKKQMIAKHLIAAIPKHLIELLAFGGVFGIILYMVGVRQTMQEIIPIAALYVLAAQRILPAFQKISGALTALRFYHKALDVISQDLATDTLPARASHLEEMREQSITYQDAIKVENVSYRYPTAQQNAVEKLTLKIFRNTSVGFVGPTGAGKSTAVDIILGLLVPQLGYVKVDETQISERTAPAWQLHTGYVPQQIFLADDTVAHNIAFGVRPEEIDHDAVARAARVAHVDQFVTDELPNGFDTLVGERGVRLSGGQRQRIAIARALYHDPEVLILDEATSALDGTTEAIIRQSIHELGGKKTLIIIAHRLNTVQDCDVIYVFEGGTIVASGGYDELMQDCKTFREMASPSARHVLR